jgi:hypothetical protein
LRQRNQKRAFTPPRYETRYFGASRGIQDLTCAVDDLRKYGLRTRNGHDDGAAKQRFQVLDQHEIVLRIFTFGEDSELHEEIEFAGPRIEIRAHRGPKHIQPANIVPAADLRTELLAYPVESAIAEKLQAMVALGSANSRMKDFYDVWIYSKHLDFHADTLIEAIEATFKNRDTPVPAEEFDALSVRFIEGHRVQWNAFVRRMGAPALIDAFGEVVADLKIFAMPALQSLGRGDKLARQWKAGNGWAVRTH